MNTRTCLAIEMVKGGIMQNEIMKDHAEQQRKEFISAVNPVRKDEQIEYAMHYFKALVFGAPMPYQRRLFNHG